MAAGRLAHKEGALKTYDIAEPCVGTKDTACVDVCPVDCIHPKKDEAEFEGENKLYIDPETCIDCGACVPVCPVQAIFCERHAKDFGTHYKPSECVATVGRQTSHLRHHAGGAQPR